VLFEKRLRDGIHDGSLTAMFRRWRRPQVVAGGHYRTMLDMIEVTDVAVVSPDAIDPADARAAGYSDGAAMLADLRGADDAPIYRIRFRRLDTGDPRAALAAADNLTDDDVADITGRLQRLDRASPRGPWTSATLAAIRDRPDVVSTELAAPLGLETVVFKRNVRSLKALGLTLSQPVGYRLSARGRAYLGKVSKRS
jgi:hypothetical protein